MILYIRMWCLNSDSVYGFPKKKKYVQYSMYKGVQYCVLYAQCGTSTSIVLY